MKIDVMSTFVWGDLFGSTQKAISTVEQNCGYRKRTTTNTIWFIRVTQITAKSKATNVDWTYTSCGEVTDDIAADIPKPLGNTVAQTLLSRCEPAQRLSHGKKCHGYIC